MPALNIRNVPKDIYLGVRKLAEQEHRSLNSEAIKLLQLALQALEKSAGHFEALADLRKLRKGFKAPASAPRSLDLLREDRRR